MLNSKINILLFILFPLLGVITLYICFQYGIGCSFDSCIYILTAENLLKGNGFNVLVSSGRVFPLVHYPPFYPILLSGIMYLGFDKLSAPMYLNVFLFGANVFLVSLILFDNTHSRFIAIVGAFFTLISPIVVFIHSRAMSEALCLFMGLAGIYFLSSYIRKNQNFFLWISSCCFGLAFFTRYAGIAFIITGMVTVFLYSRGNFKRAVHDCLILFLIGNSFILVWFVTNLSGFSEYIKLGGRKISWHFSLTSRILSFADTITQCFLPSSIPFSIRLTLGSAVGILFIYLLFIFRKKIMKCSKRMIQEKNNALIIILVCFLFSYSAMLIFSFSVVDASIPLDIRILSPLYFIVLISILCLLDKYSFFIRKNYVIYSIAIITAVIYSSLSLARSINYLNIIYKNGSGYTDRIHRESPLIAYLKKYPDNIPIYSNDPAPIYILSGRYADLLPCKINPFSREKNVNFKREINDVALKLKAKSGIIVFFHKGVQQFLTGYSLSDNDLRNEISLKTVLKNKEGEIYKCPY